MYIKTSSQVSHKRFENKLVAIRKTKVALKLNKPAYIAMCILDLNKVSMFEFRYDYIKINMATIQDYYLQTLIV